MAYAIGIALALLTGLFTRLAGLDRDRALYPVLLVVIASYYVLFAAMGGSAHTVLVEALFLTVFAAIAVVGFKRNLWLIVAALAGHGVFDFIHGRLVTNPGMPAWWPPFCLAFDVVFAAFLGWLLRSRTLRSAAEFPG